MNVKETVAMVYRLASRSTLAPLKSVCSKSLTPQFVTLTDPAMIIGYQAIVI